MLENETFWVIFKHCVIGPNYCGTDTISSLFTNVLPYHDWIDMVFKAFSKDLPPPKD